MHTIGQRTPLSGQFIGALKLEEYIKCDQQQRWIAGRLRDVDRASRIGDRAVSSSDGVQAARPYDQPERFVLGASPCAALVDCLRGGRDGLIEDAAGQRELGPGLSQA